MKKSTNHLHFSPPFPAKTKDKPESFQQQSIDAVGQSQNAESRISTSDAHFDAVGNNPASKSSSFKALAMPTILDPAKTNTASAAPHSPPSTTIPLQTVSTSSSIKNSPEIFKEKKVAGEAANSARQLPLYQQKLEQSQLQQQQQSSLTAQLLMNYQQQKQGDFKMETGEFEGSNEDLLRGSLGSLAGQKQSLSPDETSPSFSLTNDSFAQSSTLSQQEPQFFCSSSASASFVEHSFLSFTAPFLDSLQYPTGLVRLGDLMIAHLNKSALELFGYDAVLDKNEIAGLSLTDLCPNVRKKFLNLLVQQQGGSRRGSRYSGSLKDENLFRSATAYSNSGGYSRENLSHDVKSTFLIGRESAKQDVSRLIRGKKKDGSGIWVELLLSEMNSDSWFLPQSVHSDFRLSDRYLLATFRSINGSDNPSRYLSEFEELGIIGKGGFGTVYRARNKIDGQEYAIKKIKLQENAEDLPLMTSKFVREVQTFAQISNHPNVVRYFAAWTEGTYPLVMETDFESSTEEEEIFVSEFRQSSHDDGLGSEVEFSMDDLHVLPSNIEPAAEPVRIKSRSHSLKIPSTSNTSSFSPIQVSESVLQQQELFHSAPRRPKKKKKRTTTTAILYIQMQLCPFMDLKRWIASRGAHINEAESLSIFQQIVDGVNHIHQKGFVHRDIKPANIFIDGGHVFLGDFGLTRSVMAPGVSSKLTAHSRVSESSASEVSDDNLSFEDGTYLYLSPEHYQNSFTPKTDIFALGILLAELFIHFETGMERIVVLQNLKKGIIPSEIESFPKVIPILKSLIQKDPEMRPSAEELLGAVEAIRFEIDPSAFSPGSRSFSSKKSGLSVLTGSQIDMAKSMPRALSNWQSQLNTPREVIRVPSSQPENSKSRRWSSPDAVSQSTEALFVIDQDTPKISSTNSSETSDHFTPPIFSTPMPSPVKSLKQTQSFQPNVTSTEETEKLAKMENELTDLQKQLELLRSELKEKDRQIHDLKSALNRKSDRGPETRAIPPPPPPPSNPIQFSRSRLSARNSLSLLSGVSANGTNVAISTTFCIVTSSSSLPNH